MLEAAPAAGTSLIESLGHDYTHSIQPLLKTYCLTCHSTEKHKGDLDLEGFKSVQDVLQQPVLWDKVVEQITLVEMPPKEKPQPTAAERDRLLGWVRTALAEAAQANAGDPGPVVLRRLNNAEYTHTLRDLTGVDSLDPAREFPADSAAGEGFMNTGASLVMSPALITKYFDAAREIARHLVLVPDGFRFSAATTRRDWTEEILAEIRGLYRDFTDAQGGDKVNLQGIVVETNEGGRLPLERYLRAALPTQRATQRAANEKIAPPNSSTPQLRAPNSQPPSANSHLPSANSELPTPQLSPRYLESLSTLLASDQPSPVLDGIRARWRMATPETIPALAAEIARWQQALWKFSSVGHIGKVDGPKAWMEPVNPLTSRQELRLNLPAPSAGDKVVVYLSATDAGDGNAHDFVIWQQPRLVMPGRPDLLLRDIRSFVHETTTRRDHILADTARCLAAAAEASSLTHGFEASALAQRHGLEVSTLQAWLGYLGIGSSAALHLASFTNRIDQASGYDSVSGWGSPDTPLLLANASDQHLRIPGNLKPHGLTVHPSPTLLAAVGWLSPVAATLRIEATVTHAHPECGNGVTWSLERRRGSTRQRLATGTSHGGQGVIVGPIENFPVLPGDLLSLLIGPRDGNHSCDLTDLEFNLRPIGDGQPEWNLTRDVSSNIQAGNPHADRQGHAGVWHFYAEPAAGAETGPVIPSGSLLARWQSSTDPEECRRLASELQTLLTSPLAAGLDGPDALLHRQLTSLNGPLIAGESARLGRPQPAPSPVELGDPQVVTPGQQPQTASALGTLPTETAGAPGLLHSAWGPDPALFGRHPNGSPLDPASLCVQAPSVIEILLPADLTAGAELVTTAVLDPQTDAEGSVQVQVTLTKPSDAPALQPAETKVTDRNGPWTSHNQQITHTAPILVTDGSAARRRIEAAFDEFRQWFPAALCYTKIVPVDEVVTLTLFHREDHHLARLMLDEAQRARLDRLWDELHYVGRDALTLVDAFEQLWQYATQDADPKVFEPMRQPINDRATAFRQRLLNTQPKHLDAVIQFASRAYRRPLQDDEVAELRALYRKLRDEEVSHEEAIQLTLARVLVSPAFLYRLEQAAPGSKKSGPVSDWEMASRLSYFLWSSTPDDELRAAAADGLLRSPEFLARQARRMLRDPRIRRLATEFACAWLQIHDFASLDEKSARHFPTFAKLRGALYEEAILYFTDLFQRDGSVLTVLDSDHTFLNEALASHYGIPGVTGAEWRRVEGVRRFGRGGVLGLGATLAKQSGASRTSPILRGNWVAEVLLGDKLPRPPKDVPQLPEDEAAETLTVRQLVEKHSSDPRCAGCHVRIDPFGYALEGYDAIGRVRTRDLGHRPIDTRVKLFDGSPVEGADGLRAYLLHQKRDAVLRQFCRKLLGYALGRGVILSDMPLLSEMQRQLKEHDDRFSVAVETIVTSRQFREIRGKDMAAGE